MDLRSTYNKIAGDWTEDHRSDTWWVKGVDVFLSFLKPTASILDVGCGSGQKTKYLVEKGFAVTGIDFSEEMLRLARVQIPSGAFFQKDIRQSLGFPPSFDGVFAQAILLHIPKRDVVSVLRNIVAPLRPGGYICLAVKELEPGGVEEKIVREHDYGYLYKRFFSYFTLEEVKKYVTEIGMEVVDERRTPSGSTRWIQVVAKNQRP